MKLRAVSGLVWAVFLAMTPLRAATIVNLDAANSDGHAFVTTPLLAAGTYVVNVVGIAGGGLYNAYDFQAQPTSPYVWSDAFSVCIWNCTLINQGASAEQFGAGAGYQSEAADLPEGEFGTISDTTALDAWEAAGPFTFTLPVARAVTFAVDDYGTFADDSGGVSLAYAVEGPVNVPEPGSLVPLAVGVLACAAGLRHRR